MEYYRQPPSDTLHALDSTPDGLTPAQAAARLARDGRNVLTEPPKPSLVKRFFQQLADPMILVLLAAALISAITSVYAHESFADVIIILIVVIINAVLGVYQESKAEQAIAALKELSAAHSRVLRGGKLVTVPSEELVVGDVLVLEAGAAVPADARVLESASLRAEEAALTGESVPAAKSPDALTAAGDIGLGDRSNMLYLGSSIVYGRGRAVVTETGMQTQMGHIADALTQTKENKTPLQLRLTQLSRILTWLVLGICAVVFAVGVLRAGTINGRVVLDTFLIAVSLAVAAIPEGLAAVVTIVLSIGVTNMSRRGAVIRRLTAVETLGCAQVICSDKTGTLTRAYGHVTVMTTVRPELIGGVCLRIGDTHYDGTLRHALDLLEQDAANSVLHTTQKTPDLADCIRAKLADTHVGIDVFQSGVVTSLSDGICRIRGLADAMAGELLAFDGTLRGMVMDLGREDIGVVLLGPYGHLQEGDRVRRTGQIMSVPVGEEMTGRVVDALGRPIDGLGPIRTTERRAIESPAPGVIARKGVSVPLQTGIKAIDALVPIGRGQRELIIGDRQTGKTAIAIDAILNQKDTGVLCIYVAIGQKESTVAGVVQKLRDRGAMAYTTVVCAHASETAPMLYIAPYAGAAIGEYFMYRGRDVLIVYDDLSKQAVAYREISLLLQRPPGREAYPGDVFYLHSRLLERAARLSEEAGGGSMTALPIIETQAGDISAYIPTNVISITDGQIFLETDLFHAGVRPAINVGLSVSRVGGAAQLGAMKQVAGRLRMDLAQYRELASFAQFGSDLDKATRDTLARGSRMTELLKQPQYAPMDAADQVAVLFAAGEGYTDTIAVEDVPRYADALLARIHRTYPELHALVHSGKKLPPEALERLRELAAETLKNL